MVREDSGGSHLILTQTVPIETTVGPLVPLTVERFRICELYAELLHCSNMSLLNRPEGVGPSYDEDGQIINTPDALELLAAALAPPGPEVAADQRSLDSAPDSPNASSSPTRMPKHSRRHDLDGDALAGPMESLSFSSSNQSPAEGSSTPSEQASLDSESGVLTRAEARALIDILSSSQSDPFNDSAASEDAAALDLKGDLSIGSSDDGELGRSSRRMSASSRGRRSSTMVSGSNGLHRPKMPPGMLLKTKFLEHGVIEGLFG